MNTSAENDPGYTIRNQETLPDGSVQQTIEYPDGTIETDIQPLEDAYERDREQRSDILPSLFEIHANTPST